MTHEREKSQPRISVDFFVEIITIYAQRSATNKGDVFFLNFPFISWQFALVSPQIRLYLTVLVFVGFYCACE
jgi:hypothetical protein